MTGAVGTPRMGSDMSEQLDIPEPNTVNYAVRAGARWFHFQAYCALCTRRYKRHTEYGAKKAGSKHLWQCPVWCAVHPRCYHFR